FHREFIDRVSIENQFTPQFSFETNLIPMILTIVKREFAITALLKLVTDNEQGVVGIPFEEPVKLDLALAWRKDGYQSKADRTFIDFVKQYV
ncbi:LysR family transcriptional regulator substrate-binding protein, partial [Vibrio genomosp. F10]